MATTEEQVRASIERERTRRRNAPAALIRNIGLERGAGINPGPAGDFSQGPPPASRTAATLAPGRAAGSVGIGVVEPAATRPAQTQPVTRQAQSDNLGATIPDPNAPRLPTDATIRGDVGTQAAAGDRGPTVIRPAFQRTLTGDVGTQTTAPATAQNRASPAAGVGTVPTGSTTVEQSQRIAQQLGVLGPDDAPTAEAPARVDQQTNQRFRDTIQQQQLELFDMFNQAREALANADPNPGPEATRRRQLLRSELEAVATALGQNTQAGVNAFSANRRFDQGVTTAGIGADTDVAVANANNATSLGIAQGRALTDLFTGITSANATQRAADIRAAAEQTTDPVTQFNLTLASQFAAANDPFTAFRLANGQTIDPQQLEQDSQGNIIGVRAQNGQIISLDNEQLSTILNRLQSIREGGV